MKIASLNTGHARWDYDLSTWAQRSAYLAEVIQVEQIDVLALQEIYQIKCDEADEPLRKYMAELDLPPRDFDKLGMLMSFLPPSFAGSPALIPSQDRGVTQAGLYWGLGVVARVPLGTTRIVELTYTKFDRWPRIVQCVEDSALPGPLLNVHLAAENAIARQRGAWETVRLLDKLASRSTICLGDLNDHVDSGPVFQFRSRMDDMWERSPQRQLFADGNRVEAGSSLARACLDARIDFAFAQEDIVVRSVRYLYQGTGTLLADHPLVIADIVLSA